MAVTPRARCTSRRRSAPASTTCSATRSRASRPRDATSRTCLNERLEVLGRIEQHIRRHDLIEPGGEVLCLVSGGADSTCLYHALSELGYRVAALHVDHGLRGAESDADAAWCVERFGAEVVQGAARCATEAELRDVRYSFHASRLRATGHTLSDQVETILYRLAARGTTAGIE